MLPALFPVLWFTLSYFFAYFLCFANKKKMDIFKVVYCWNSVYWFPSHLWVCCFCNLHISFVTCLGYSEVYASIFYSKCSSFKGIALGRDTYFNFSMNDCCSWALELSCPLLSLSWLISNVSDESCWVGVASSY